MFARHFEAQSFDAAGKLGVQLQKTILFLVFASVLSLVDLRVSTIVGVAVMVIVYATGVHGAARRRRCALACYSVLMSIYVALTVALLVFLLVMTVYARVNQPVEDADADSSDAAVATVAPLADSASMTMAASMMPALPSMVHAMLGRPVEIAPTSAPEVGTGSEEGEEAEQAEAAGLYRAPMSPWYYVLASLYFFACMVTFAMKLYTIKLATTMHRHLLIAERAGNADESSRSSCCRVRACQKSEPVEAATATKSSSSAPAEVVYVAACYPAGVNDEATPGSSSYPPNCYQPLNQAAEH
jgi:hypothetical protein